MKRCPFRKSVKYYANYPDGDGDRYKKVIRNISNSEYSEEYFLDCIRRECAAWDPINGKCEIIWGNK